MVNADIEVNCPPIPRSRASLQHRTASITHPTELGESSTETFVDGFRVGAQFVFDTFISTENVFSPIIEGMF